MRVVETRGVLLVGDLLRGTGEAGVGRGTRGANSLLGPVDSLIKLQVEESVDIEPHRDTCFYIQ